MSHWVGGQTQMPLVCMYDYSRGNANIYWLLGEGTNTVLRLNILVGGRTRLFLFPGDAGTLPTGNTDSDGKYL